MANLGHNDVQSRSKEIKLIVGKLGILGNTTPANGTFSIEEGGEGIAAFTRTDTGKYRIELQDKYQKLMGVSLTVLAAAAVDLVPQVRAEAVNGATPYIDFEMLAGGTATDTANAVQQYVMVIIAVKNTDAT